MNQQVWCCILSHQKTFVPSLKPWGYSVKSFFCRSLFFSFHFVWQKETTVETLPNTSSMSHNFWFCNVYRSLGSEFLYFRQKDAHTCSNKTKNSPELGFKVKYRTETTQEFLLEFDSVPWVVLLLGIIIWKWENLNIKIKVKLTEVRLIIWYWVTRVFVSYFGNLYIFS